MTDSDSAPSEVALPVVPLVGVVESDNRLVGVGGWLLFFCISLTMLNPSMTLFNVGSSIVQNVPYFGRSLGLIILVVVDAVISLSIGALSLYAGILLWRVRPEAVQVARTFLILGAIYTILAPFSPLLLGLSATVRSQILDAALLTIGRGLLYYIIWLNYLLRSKRVRATYADWNPPVVGRA